MKINKVFNNRYNPYLKFKSSNLFMYKEILQNIRKFYDNIKSDKKGNILSIVAYNNIKDLLKESGFKFTNNQFNNAISKRLNNEFNFDSYKRRVPLSKKKLNEHEIEIIINYLNHYSRESSSKDTSLKYL